VTDSWPAAAKRQVWDDSDALLPIAVAGGRVLADDCDRGREARG
jgi:hypothetical protein